MKTGCSIGHFCKGITNNSSIMKITSISDPSTVELAIREIHKGPILVQLPTVFGLLAAPTSKGARQLDSSKIRLAGKNYGTAIGSLTNFVAQAKRDHLPDNFNCTEQYANLIGAFIRLPFREDTFQSKTIKNGTHQGLLLKGAYSALFQQIETSFASYSPDEIWNYTNYCAPLCTSCNISGDPDGSIVEFSKAKQFAETMGINLLITADKPSTEKGSYPILGFEKQRVNIHRAGPGLDGFRTKIPAALRAW